MLSLFPRLKGTRPSFVRFGAVVLVAGLISPVAAIAQGSCSISGSTVTCTSSHAISTANNNSYSPMPEPASSYYPDEINVPYTGTVTAVQLTLDNISTGTSGLFYTQVVLIAPSGQKLVVLGGAGQPTDQPTSLTMNIADGNSSLMPYQDPSNNPIGGDLPSTGTQSYKPTDILDNEGTGGGVQPALPGTGYTLNSSNWPRPDGSATLTGIFNGATANGNWRLYLADWNGDPITINGWGLALTIQNATATTTTVSSSPDPVVASSSGTSVTFTGLVQNGATAVTDTGATMAFYANGVGISGCSAQTVSSTTGKATCTVNVIAGSAATCESTTTPTFPTVCQGGRTIITATYSGVNNGGGDYASSTSSGYTQWVGGTITNPATNQYCNTNPLYIPNATSATGYPSYITVSGYSTSTVYSASVQLQGISTADGVFGQFLLVSPDGTHNLAFLDHSFALSPTSSMNLDFIDSAGVYPGGSGTPSNGTSCTEANGNSAYCWDAYTYVSDTFTSADSGLPNTIPSLPGTINYAGTSSINAFANKFGGATANGNWALYATNGNGANITTVANGWCITLTPSLTQTTTTVTASPNPALTNQSVTYGATVTSSGSPVTSGGSVEFLDNGSNPAGTLENINLGSGNTASFSSSSLYDSINDANSSTIKLYEGDHTITADYSGSSSDDPSSGTVLERINNATTFSAGSGSTINACNTGGIYLNQGNQGALTPNPSIITVANMPGTVNAVNLTLKSFSTYSQGETNDLESLVEGPTGKTLDFFSGVNSTAALTSGNYVFKDGGASPGGSFGPNTYEAASELGNDSFISGYYTAPSSGAIVYAQPKGTGTFQSQFQNTNPNGNWALFFNMNTGQNTIGAAGGWCLNFTENSVTINPTLGHSGTGTGGDFTQGESGASIKVNVATGSSTGSTGDPLGTNPLTVKDTLPSGLTYVSGSDTNWTCSASGQTVTCTDDAAVGQGSSYPQLTIKVNVSAGASGSLSNSITVSGAGTSSTPANDTIPIDVATAISVGNVSTSYSAGVQNVTLTANVTNNGTGISGGTVTFDVFNGGTLIGTGATSGAVSNGAASVSYSIPGGTAPGTYSVDATYNGSGSYQVSSENTATLTINSVTPTFTWNPITTIILGTAGTNVLNASVNCTSCGTVSYTDTPSGGSPASITTTSGLAAGTYTITANFTPTTGYSSNSTTKQLTVSTQSVWVVNSGGGTAELAGNGYAITSSAYSGGNTAVAIDSSGNVWTISSGSTPLADISQTGSALHSVSSGGGLDVPAALAIDGNSDVWVVNSANNSISLFLNNGTAASPSTGFTDGSLSTPSGVAVDLSGSVWVANKGNNSVTRILGAAAPVAPLSTAAANKTTGAKP